MSKATKQEAATKALARVAKEIAAEIESGNETPEQLQAARCAKTNTKGEMLLCDFTLQKAIGKPDPLCITINGEVRWVKRGAKVKVPWYLVEHMLHNIERKFHQIPDPTDARRRIVKYDDMTTEAFNYMPINPAINPVTGEAFEIEGPREQVVTTM